MSAVADWWRYHREEGRLSLEEQKLVQALSAYERALLEHTAAYRVARIAQNDAQKDYLENDVFKNGSKEEKDAYCAEYVWPWASAVAAFETDKSFVDGRARAQSDIEDAHAALEKSRARQADVKRKREELGRHIKDRAAALGSGLYRLLMHPMIVALVTYALASGCVGGPTEVVILELP